MRRPSRGLPKRLNPTATGAYAYDGEGERVWQQDTATNGSTTTTTTVSYILGDEVPSTPATGQQTTTTASRYYPLPGGVTAVRDASGLSYTGSDLLGTPIATFNLDTGTVTGLQLRAPYGQPRFAATGATAGGMHTPYGVTGQPGDVQAPGSSGLAYFHARSYDPVVGRFTTPHGLVGATCSSTGNPHRPHRVGYVRRRWRHIQARPAGPLDYRR